MYKHSMVVIIFLEMALPVAAIQEQTDYRWYQSYKNPVVRQKALRGWHQTKEFAKKYKREIMLVAVLMGATYIGNRGYNKIANTVRDGGLDLESLKERKQYKDPRRVSHEILKLAIGAYIRPKSSFSDYWNSTVVESEVYGDLAKKERDALFDAIIKLME